MTPTIFCETVTEKLAPLGVKCKTLGKEFILTEKMGAFWSVAKGSIEEPKMLKLEYNGPTKAGNKKICLVGKGVTFDAGGISIKPSANMDAMRADMGGAACVLASIYTAARLQLPINLMAFIPCAENMPALRATKPGDVFTSMSGKTVQVDNTDAEGRLVLCDALCYAQTFNPRGILDMATLTGAMVVALGSACT